MKINTSYLVLKTDQKVSEDATKVRGYIGNKFKEYSILHNHYSKDKFLYSYPLVQYKVFEGQVSILGIEEGSDVLKKISSELDELKLSSSYEIEEKILYEKKYDVKPTKEERHYEFLSPWLGLNQKNYNTYSNMHDWKEKKLFLNNILVGNILSMSKGLGIIVNKRLYVKSNFSKTVPTKYKSVIMDGFIGEFKVFYDIPDFFGIGKGVSQGFGSIKKIEEKS